MAYILYKKTNVQGGNSALLKFWINQCIDRLIGTVSDVFELKFKLSVTQNIFLKGKKQKKNCANGCLTLYTY